MEEIGNETYSRGSWGRKPRQKFYFVIVLTYVSKDALVGQ